MKKRILLMVLVFLFVGCPVFMQPRAGSCADPIVITGWASNHTRGTKCLEVAWLGGGKWRRKIVDRNALADGRRFASERASVGAAVYMHTLLMLFVMLRTTKTRTRRCLT